MRILSRKNLLLVGSSATMDGVKELIGEKLNLRKVETKLSYKFEHRGGKVFDVGDSGKFFTDVVIILTRGHHSFYRIIN